MTSALIKSSAETILLVEDESHLREFFYSLLTSKGYGIIMAVDGQDAVEKYIDNMGCIDLVLMDIMMPRKDGLTARREIIALNASFKILMMSGYSAYSSESFENINFVQKPFSPPTLLLHIRSLLGSNIGSLSTLTSEA